MHFACSFSSLDTARVRAGPVGLPEVEVSPVHFIEGLTLGQRRVPEGGQRHQRGVEEEGTESVGPWAPGGRAEPVGVHDALPRLTFTLGGASWALL